MKANTGLKYINPFQITVRVIGTVIYSGVCFFYTFAPVRLIARWGIPSDRVFTGRFFFGICGLAMIWCCRDSVRRILAK